MIRNNPLIVSSEENIISRPIELSEEQYSKLTAGLIGLREIFEIAKIGVSFSHLSPKKVTLYQEIRDTRKITKVNICQSEISPDLVKQIKRGGISNSIMRDVIFDNIGITNELPSNVILR